MKVTKIKKLGEDKLEENIVIDSRLAWNFIPKSFKVFIDVSWEMAGARLLEANRASEQAKDIKSATDALKDRWQVENARYYELYNTNNLNPNNYNLVISSDDKIPEEIVEIIYSEYLKYMQK